MAESLTGKLIADKYRVETPISEGGEGDLYAGRHEVMDKPVTIKVLPRALGVDARWTKRFVDEARTASVVTHPNVLSLTDFGTDAKGISYAVFEPAPSSTLKDILTGGPSMDEKRALDIAAQIAAGVAAAHAKKVVHGRLNPADIYVNTAEGERDEVKAYGFGASPMSVPQDADPRYLAHEQLTAFQVADERTDVYAVGVMLYEMLGGVVPYEGVTTADIQKSQENEPPPPLTAFRKDLNPEIEPIVLSAIAVAPERRYQTMAAFAEDLELLSTRLGAPKAAAAASGSNTWRAAFIVLAGVALLSAALIYATSVRQTDPTTQLQADAGSLPVQPIGPASGTQEENLAKRPLMTDDEIKAAMNANTALTPDQLPGGDGYNPWATGGPPLGAPPTSYVPPGGQTMTLEPGNSSQFMPQELPPGCTMLPSGVVLCPKPVNPADAAKPTPTPKEPAANTATGQATPTPATTPKPMATPVPKPKATPAKTRGGKPADTDL
jgi:serine/threonine protein kinase